MKKIIVTVLTIALGGCTFHNSPYRAADVSLAQNGQPCVAIPADSLTKGGKSKLLVLKVSERFADKNMHQVWERNDIENPTFRVQPGECLPISFQFEKDKEYSVNAITAFSVSEVETKRIWSAAFALEKPAQKQ